MKWLSAMTATPVGAALIVGGAIAKPKLRRARPWALLPRPAPPAP